MLPYARLMAKPSAFRQLTGLSVVEFDRLLADVAVAQQARTARPRLDRRRRPGGGRKHALGLADRLLLTLVYYRTYVSQEFLGVLFGIDKGTACRTIQALALLLAGIFRIPERTVRIEPGEMAEAFVDATEQPTYRPTRRQRRSYSGKKKRHTVKHQVVVVRRRKPRGRRGQPRKVRIAGVSPAARGKVHDKKLYDRAGVRLPAGVTGYGDSGYQGTDLRVPERRPRNGTLSRRAKRGNRRLARKRVVAEHGIGKMKIWRIAADRYRNPWRRHTVMMKNVAGLHNRMFA